MDETLRAAAAALQGGDDETLPSSNCANFITHTCYKVLLSADSALCHPQVADSQPLQRCHSG